ncbi:MAG: ATP-binding protein, partial [Chitinophagaceae bacterium]
FERNRNDFNFAGLNEIRNAFEQAITYKSAVKLPAIQFDIPGNHGIVQYFTITNKPVIDDQGNVGYIIYSAVDITNQIYAELREEERAADLQQQKSFINSILDASFNGIYALKTVRNEQNVIIDLEYLFANKAIAHFLAMEAQEMVGKTILELIPENRNNGFFDLFCNVLEKGEPVRDETHFVTKTFSGWFHYSIVPIDKDVLVVTLQNLTAQKNALLQIEQQKNLLDNIMKYSPSGISVSKMMRDEEDNIIDARTLLANEAAVKFTGIPHEIYLSKTVLELDPNIMRSPYYKMVLNTLNTGEPFHTQYFLKPTARWLEISVSKMAEDHIITIFTDVTTTKEAQLKLEQSAERLAAVFNNSQSGMFTFIPVWKEEEIVDFRFVITNPAFAAYVGQVPEVLNGELGSTWFPGYLHNGVFDMYKNTFLTGKAKRMDIHYNVDQHDLYLDLMSTKVGEEILVTFTDYTPLKKAQLQLEKYVEELKMSNDELEQFAYVASHDLQEPLRKIRFFSDMISAGAEEGSDVYKYVNKVHDSAKRMTGLINSLLDYSSLSRRNTRFEKVNLNSILESVISDYELLIKQKNAIIKAGVLPTIEAIPLQMNQLLFNLVGNALKFTKKGVPLELTIHAKKLNSEKRDSFPELQKHKEYIEITVQDNGIGFSQEYAGKIFTIFQRLNDRSIYGGYGIGLAVCKKVVDSHKGIIYADGKPKEGATFTIILPYQQH